MIDGIIMSTMISSNALLIASNKGMRLIRPASDFSLSKTLDYTYAVLLSSITELKINLKNIFAKYFRL